VSAKKPPRPDAETPSPRRGQRESAPETDRLEGDRSPAPFDLLRQTPATGVEARYQAILNSARDAILILEGDVVVECNAVALAMFEAKPEHVLGQTQDHFCKPHERDRRHWSDDLAAWVAAAFCGESRVFECRCVRSSGAHFSAEVSLDCFEVDDRSMLLVMIRDITERRKLEEELRHSQKMEAIARLAGGIAHDFNNLLTAINGYSAMLLDSMGPQDPRRADVQEILDAGRRAGDLTHRLLAFSRTQVFETKDVDLNEILDRVCRMLRPILGERIKIVTAPAPDLESTRANPGHIEQIIANLAVNARDAMWAGGEIKIETANIQIGESDPDAHAGLPPGPYVMLSVCDSGEGMSEEVRARACEPFFTTKEDLRGTGLGLSTVHGIVKQYGGDIQIDSTPGEGTCVRVYLPRAQD
jgi:PAS domain S-box-containing protein